MLIPKFHMYDVGIHFSTYVNLGKSFIIFTVYCITSQVKSIVCFFLHKLEIGIIEIAIIVRIDCLVHKKETISHTL